MGDSGLPAVFVSDETGCLSPVTAGGPRSARRSADMSAQFRAVKGNDAPVFSPLSRDSGSEANRGWDAKMEAKTGAKLQQVPAAHDSNAQAPRMSDEEISKTRTKSFSGTCLLLLQFPCHYAYWIMQQHKLHIACCEVVQMTWTMHTDAVKDHSGNSRCLTRYRSLVLTPAMGLVYQMRELD